MKWPRESAKSVTVSPPRAADVFATAAALTDRQRLAFAVHLEHGGLAGGGYELHAFRSDLPDGERPRLAAVDRHDRLAGRQADDVDVRRGRGAGSE